MIEYKLRPAYESQKPNEELLIEFVDVMDADTFINKLETALASLKAEVSMKLFINFWLHDDIAYKLKTTKGSCELSIDYVNTGFILAENNQSLIASIDSLLYNSSDFKKIAVNFSHYG